jgi:transposase
LFTWRRQEASTNAVGSAEPLKLLPVTVADPGTVAGAAATQSQVGQMEIVLVGGERIIIGADVDAPALVRVVKALSRR